MNLETVWAHFFVAPEIERLKLNIPATCLNDTPVCCVYRAFYRHLKSEVATMLVLKPNLLSTLPLLVSIVRESIARKLLFYCIRRKANIPCIVDLLTKNNIIWIALFVYCRMQTHLHVGGMTRLVVEHHVTMLQ